MGQEDFIPPSAFPQTMEQPAPQTPNMSLPPMLGGGAADPRLSPQAGGPAPSPLAGVLKALPALAAAIASGRSGMGGLGSFMQGWQHQQALGDQNKRYLHQIAQEQLAEQGRQLQQQYDIEKSQRQAKLDHLNTIRTLADIQVKQGELARQQSDSRNKAFDSWLTRNRPGLTNLQSTQGVQALSGMQTEINGEKIKVTDLLDGYLEKDPQTGEYLALTGKGLDNSSLYKTLSPSLKNRLLSTIMEKGLDPRSISDDQIQMLMPGVGKAELTNLDTKQKIQVNNLQQSQTPNVNTSSAMWAASPAPPDPDQQYKPDSKLGGVTQAAIYEAGLRWVFQGQGQALQGLGLSGKGQPWLVRSAVINKGSALARASGVDAPTLQFEWGAAKKQTQDNITGFVQAQGMSVAAGEYADLAKAQGDKTIRSGSPLANSVMQKIIHASGLPTLPELSQFEVYVYAFSRDYAKVVNAGRNLSSGNLTNYAQEAADRLLSVSQNPQQFNAAVDAMMTELRANMKSRARAISSVTPNIGKFLTAPSVSGALGLDDPMLDNVPDVGPKQVPGGPPKLPVLPSGARWERVK